MICNMMELILIDSHINLENDSSTLIAVLLVLGMCNIEFPWLVFIALFQVISIWNYYLHDDLMDHVLRECEGCNFPIRNSYFLGPSPRTFVT